MDEGFKKKKKKNGGWRLCIAGSRTWGEESGVTSIIPSEWNIRL